MRESKLLKVISYILIPILVLIILLSIFYEIAKSNLTDENRYNHEYFESDNFLSIYMARLYKQTENLIYHNERYTTVTDNQYKICYCSGQEYYDSYFINIKDFYYIILYENLAITNVELTSETNTIDKIMNYIETRYDSKKANIINGNVEADSDVIKNKAIQYFEDFKNTYYTITTEENTTSNYPYASDDLDSETIEETVDLEAIEEPYKESNNTLDSNNTERLVKTFHTATINDLKIYTSYKEEVTINNNDAFFKELSDHLAPYEIQMYYAIPVCTIIVAILGIYLIIAIGHTKGKNGIDINDFDKIPIEIILFIAFIIIGRILAATEEFVRVIYDEYYNFAISILITGYFVSYIICALTGVTTIKRIKAKILIKDSITGRTCRFCFKILKKILKQINKACTEISNSLSITLKVIMFIVVYAIGLVLLVGLFEGLGAGIAFVITAYLVYKFIERINCYKKIENHLKEMYEGDHSKKLFTSDFVPEFQDIVKYINDISNGFENAIQEGIKSEKLKTELITNVSHDIKTPLTSIINYVDLLKKEEIDNSKIKEYIEILDSKSQRLKKLTEDLVEASKASSGNVKLNIEKINIGELIKQTTGEFEDRFNDKKLEIITAIPEGIVYISADNRYMYRVIENLFSNISKYALENSRVYIDVVRDGGKVKISIKNISRERLNISADELMQRFVRGYKSRTTEGSGLGISISKSLTEIQQGKFDLQVDGDLFKVELEFDIV